VTVTEEPVREVQAVEHEGFNLNASVCIEGDDDLARERLLRYGCRPPFALERFGRRPDGSITYRIKKLAHGAREKVRVMTPLELLARLSALVPPPRYPLVRYHGVLAPASKWRRNIVPKPREPQRHAVACQRKPQASTQANPPQAAPVAQRSTADGRRSAPTSPASGLPTLVASAPELPSKLAPGVTLLAPNVLSVPHWQRLLGGRLLAPPVRVDWARLLQRTFEVDVLACSKCGGRLRVLGEVTEPAMVRLVLESLAMPTDAPRAARARDPTALLGGPDE
jgi:hypothetical protein